MRVLLAGGNSFIGRSAAAHLLGFGYTVGIYSRSCAEKLDGCTYHCRDLSSDQELGSLLKSYPAVIYLVTNSSPKSSMEQPQLVYEKEIPMFLRFMDCCVESGVSRVIYASSGGTVYGKSLEKSQESGDTWPSCHYGIGKMTCEKILNLYNQIYHMENICLRIANPYGIGQLQKSGEGAVTMFAKQIIRNKSITLYGDGHAVRDFLDVSYIAEAFRLALEWEFDETISPAFNIGSGTGMELNQVISIISDAVGKAANVEYLPARAFDVPYNCLDIEKARTYLGYRPPADIRGDIASYAIQLAAALDS